MKPRIFYFSFKILIDRVQFFLKRVINGSIEYVCFDSSFPNVKVHATDR